MRRACGPLDERLSKSGQAQVWEAARSARWRSSRRTTRRESAASRHDVGVNAEERPPGEPRFMSNNEYVAEFGWRGRLRLTWLNLRRGEVHLAWHGLWIPSRRR